MLKRYSKNITEATKPANKRRKRKGSSAAAAGIGLKKGGSPRPNFSLASQDVMVVGEPSLMGGEFGEEDERLITRLENNQYDPSGVGHPGPQLDTDPVSTFPGSGLQPAWSAPDRGLAPPPPQPPSQDMPDLKRSPPNS